MCLYVENLDVILQMRTFTTASYSFYSVRKDKLEWRKWKKYMNFWRFRKLLQADYFINITKAQLSICVLIK